MPASAGGGDSWDRTSEYGGQNPMPYLLAMSLCGRTWQAHDSCQALLVFPSRHRRKVKKRWATMDTLEPATGIEPALPAWKAGALPLSYTDGWCREQIPPTPGCRSFPAAI